LLSQFLCPAENIRQDEYGGSISNRLRISIEIIQGIKEDLGERLYPLTLIIHESINIKAVIRFMQILETDN
jgi:2,4-dienoyl-CoA reductase-like NADH-dependent reductase (Old Yellow Enzyme family)